MIETLKYYSKDGTLTEFNKYTIDINGVIKNKNGHTKASVTGVDMALNGTYNTAYGRTWKHMD